MNKIYNNYHKHDHISNIFTPDTHIKTIHYLERIQELGYGSYFTTNHGSGGDVFESLTLCKQYDIRCIYGIEGYIVKNPLEKDTRNYHIIIIPVDNTARKKLNLITSRANIEGFYYKPRIFLEDLLKLNPNDVYITTACIAGIVRDKEGITDIFLPLVQHFGKNVFLEVQNHNDNNQKKINDICLKLSEKFKLELIAGNDSHYIYPSQAKDRLDFLKGKGINYGTEDSFILDFPDYDTMFLRFQNQGVLSDEQITKAINNTLIFEKCEDINIDKSIKMPSIYPNLSADEKICELKKHIAQNFKQIIKEENIQGKELERYKQGIYSEMKVIEDTKEINTADYFLLNEKLVDLAVNKYGGVLTRTGRGSCGSYYINRILGMTQLDRFKLDIKLYPERFMSTARLLENRAMPDIDFNIVEQEPFIKASKELLGDNGCYPMIAYGTMQLSEAFRNVCRSKGLNINDYNEIAKNIDNYIDDNKWKPYITEAKMYQNTIISASVHPCAFLLSNNNILEEYGVVKIGDNICVMITSSEADEYKMLKDDFLIVTVYKLINETFKLIGKPIMPLKELCASLDDKVWSLFENKLTCTLNQVDGDWATSLLETFKPKNVSDMSMFVACLRPFFNSWRDDFISRKPNISKSEHLNKLLESTNGYILFQENLMQYFEWLGITPAESIGLIKKISKKKIHKEDFEALETRLKDKWLENTGSMNYFDDTWDMIQSCISYGFCVSGKTRLYRNGNGNKYIPTVEEMYNIKNSHKYAVETNHLSLYKKYRKYGYGKALSMSEDNILYENEIIDIHFTGTRKVYRVKVESGATIDCTLNHKFPTPKGVFELSELNIGDSLYLKDSYQKRLNSSRLTKEFTPNYPKKGECGFQNKPTGDSVIFKTQRNLHKKNRDCCEMCGVEYNIDKSFELHHIDLDRTNNVISNYKWLCNSCHKKIHYKNNRNARFKRGLTTRLEKIISIEYIGKENVYSISMDNPYHTFTVESGIVTSNCSSHAVGVAIDCLYGAYLKSHYPLEYYTVALENYSNNVEKTTKLMNELPYFNIKIENIKFGKSSSHYNIDRDNRTIYKNISSIKYCNSTIAEELMELSKNKKYDNFVELLYDIKNTSVDNRQLEILIILNFFSDFGNNKYLLEVTKIFNEFSSSKIIKKSKIEELGIDECIVKKYSNKETATQYRELDNKGLILAICSKIKNNTLSIKEQIKAEIEYLGYTTYVNSDINEDYYIVINYKCFKDATRPYMTLRNINNGEEIKTRITQSKIYKDNPFGEYSILKVEKKGFIEKFKKKCIGGEWTESDELELILECYEVII